MDFKDGKITSDAGLFLLLQADETLGLVPGLADCIRDNRDPWYVDHGTLDLLFQNYTSIVRRREWVMYQD